MISLPRVTASSSASFGGFLPAHTFSSSSSIAVRTCTKLPSRTPRELFVVLTIICSTAMFGPGVFS